MSPRSARGRIVRFLVAGAGAVAVGAVLSGCAGVTGGFTKVTFIPADQSGPQVEIAASGAAVPEYRIPGGRDGRLLLEFGGPYGDGTGLGDTCTITWDKVGTKNLKPVDNGASYSVAYDLPGGVSAGSSQANLSCKIATGDKGGGSFEMQFVIITAYDYVYFASKNSIGRVRTDGTDMKLEFIPDVKDVGGIAIYADTIYFSNSRGIGRADLDGTDVERQLIWTGSVPGALTATGDTSGRIDLEWEQAGGKRIGHTSWDKGDLSVSTSPAPNITAMALGGRTWYYALRSSSDLSVLSSPAYRDSAPRLSSSRVPGIVVVDGTPYWTHDNRISTFENGTTRKDVLTAGEPSLKFKGLSYAGPELVTVAAVGKANVLYAVDPDNGDARIVTLVGEATGPVAAGPGRDPSPRVSVEDSDGKAIKEVVGPTYSSPTPPMGSISFNLRNSGNADLKTTFITVISGDRQSFTETRGTGSCYFATVGAGSRCLVALDYDPSAPGKHRAVVRVSGNMNPTGYVDVPVSAEWIQTAPQVSASPASVDFGPHAPGYPSEYTTVTVTNTGAADLTIPAGGVTLAGTNRDDFDFSSTCDDVTIQPGQSCTIDVLFNPTATGSRSGSLQIASNAAGSPKVVSLTGSGVPPALSFSPDPVPSVSAQVNTMESLNPITVTNTSGAPVAIPAGGVQITGADAGVFMLASQTCADETLAPGATCSAQIDFSPGFGTLPGDYTADLEITHDGAGNPLMITLSGTATSPPS